MNEKRDQETLNLGTDTMVSSSLQALKYSSTLAVRLGRRTKR